MNVEARSSRFSDTRAWRRRFAVALGAVTLISLTLIPTRANAAVTITALTAKAAVGQIVLRWKTATEINNSGFNLLRSSSPNGAYAKIAGLIPSATPGSILGADYSYADSSVAPGETYFYKLEAVERSGAKEQFGPVSAVLSAMAPKMTYTITPTPAPLPQPATPTSPRASMSVPSSAPASPTRSVTALLAAPTQTRPTQAQLSSNKSATPAASLVAVAKESFTTEIIVDTKATAPQPLASTLDRADYLNRLVKVGVLLISGALLFGAAVLSVLALALFVGAAKH